MREQNSNDQIGVETTTEALILRKVPYSGSSMIASAYTRDYGIMSFMIRGIGKKRGNKLSALEPLAMVDISFHLREKYEVQTVKEISAKTSGGLFYDPIKGSIQLFLAEMLYKSLREESSDEELFNYIKSSLEYFNAGIDHTYFHLVFLIKLSKFFGFFPKGDFDQNTVYFDLQNGMFTSNRNSSLHTIDREESSAFYKIMRANYSSSLKIQPEERRRLIYSIVEYYRLHLEGFGEVKSLPVLIEVFST
ncbi:MAG TPA: DNA repair protein RecO [Cryomorphaceae bacterium]|nr:DNA repair protein RecO [Cryomorphaceae bacterium]